MKRFLLNLLLFTVGFFTLAFLIDLVPVSDDYMIYKTAASSFEKIAWNLNLIKREPSRIEDSNLFFGPSLTQAGLNDSLLSVNGVPSINFGINGAGNEVSLYFLRRTLASHPAKIYLHMFKDGHKDLHKMTPLLYDPVSLLTSGQSLDWIFFQYLTKRPYFILDYIGWKLTGSEAVKENYRPFGVVPEPPGYSKEEYKAIDKTKTEEYFEACNLSKTNFIRKQETGRSGLVFSVIRFRRMLLYYLWNSEFTHNCRSQERFVNTAFDLCKKNNVPVSRLYMPLIADARSGRSFGPEFYFPGPKEHIVSPETFSFLDSADYWSDMTHLSGKGSEVFSRQLLQQNIVTP